MKNKPTFKGIGGLNYPAADKIGSRITTIARSMASTLMPRYGMTDQLRTEMAEKLQQKDKTSCVYCGRKATHLDHLHPLIKNHKPSGYYTEPCNLVPCCGSCNQKKGNDEWEDYMHNKKYEDYLNHDNKRDERFSILSSFVDNYPAKQFNLSNEIIQKWDKEHKEIEDKLKEIQDWLRSITLEDDTLPQT